jgi:hypothetical protein
VPVFSELWPAHRERYIEEEDNLIHLVSPRSLFTSGYLIVLSAPTCIAQPVVPNCDSLSWQDCATMIESVLESATTPADAMQAWGAWSGKYDLIYRNFGAAAVTPSDLDRIEDSIRDKIDSWSSPTDIALDTGLKRYFPLLAGVMEFAWGPTVSLVSTILIPSPDAPNPDTL